MSPNNTDTQHLSGHSPKSHRIFGVLLLDAEESHDWQTGMVSLRSPPLQGCVLLVNSAVVCLSVNCRRKQKFTFVTSTHTWSKEIRAGFTPFRIQRVIILFNYSLLKQWWQRSSWNLASRVDRGLPGLTFAGQDSFTEGQKCIRRARLWKQLWEYVICVWVLGVWAVRLWTIVSVCFHESSVFSSSLFISRFGTQL